jgi:uncharacterized protein (TIGR03000 family)
MYSVVLMMALTGGSESVDFGGRRCHGCSSNGCSSSCASSCHGGRGGCHGGGLFRGHGRSRCHGNGGCHGGCNGGCHAVSHGCNGGGCHGGGLFSRGHGCNGGGCHGGLFSRHRSRCHGCNGGCNGGCHGGCASSCNGGSACSGCTGGTTTTGEKVKVMPKEEKKKPSEEASTSAPATIVVSLPAEAKLTVDGNATRSTTDRRTFTTPALEAGQTFVYSLRAEIVRDGQVAEQIQEVAVRSGETTNVSFTFASQGVASR